MHAHVGDCPDGILGIEFLLLFCELLKALFIKSFNEFLFKKFP
jgi:hypothetical protein